MSGYGGLERERLFSRLHDDIVRRWEAGEFDEVEMERRLDKIEGKSLKQLKSRCQATNSENVKEHHESERRSERQY